MPSETSATRKGSPSAPESDEEPHLPRGTFLLLSPEELEAEFEPLKKQIAELQGEVDQLKAALASGPKSEEVAGVLLLVVQLVVAIREHDPALGKALIASLRELSQNNDPNGEKALSAVVKGAVDVIGELTNG